MPPVRLLELFPEGTSWSFRRDSLAKRPQHALAAATLIVSWAAIEAQLANIMASILKGSPRVGLEIMQSLRSFDAQAKALRRIARLQLPEQHADVLAAVLNIMRRPADTRHAFAHHHWGVSDAIDDGLLLADPMMERIWHVQRLESAGDLTREEREDLDAYVTVYRLADLLDAQATMDRAIELAELLNRSLVSREAPRGPSLIKRLAAEPDIAAEVADMQRRAEKRATGNG